MYKTRKKLVLIGMNIFSIIFFVGISLFLLPEKTTPTHSTVSFVVTVMVFLIAVFWGNRIRTTLMVKVRKDTLESGETVIINEFIDLLNFLCTGLKVETLPQEDMIMPTAPSVEAVISTKDAEFDEIDQREEHQKKIEKAEKIYLSEMEENLRLMKKERNRQRLYKRGNYEVFHNFFEIPKDKRTNVDIDGEVYDANIRTTKSGKKMLVGGIGNKISAINFRATENKVGCPVDRLILIEQNAKLKGKNAPSNVVLGVRPVHVNLANKGIEAKIDVTELMGSELHLHLNSNGKDVVVVVPTTEIDVDKLHGSHETVYYTFKPELMHVFNKQTEEALF